MAKKALFSGLIRDQFGNPVDVTSVGGESFYVLNDAGFKRHVDSEHVDRQVLEQFAEMIRGHEDLISEGTMKALGQDDIFTKAVIERSLENVDEQFDKLIETGLPDDVKTWMGMQGFSVEIDMHGDVTSVDQPGGVVDD